MKNDPVLDELQGLWDWFVHGDREYVPPELRMNEVGNEIRRRIMKRQGYTDAEIAADE